MPLNLHLDMPRITVVMPLYNKEQYVQRAVSSVFAQTFQDFELIVVNDGSTDKGPEKVITIKDERIKIIEQPNAGVSAARNRGIQEAKSDLIAFLDADDEWLPDFLETIFRLRKNFPSCSVFATDYRYYDGKGNYRDTVIKGIPKTFQEGILYDYFTIAAQSDPPLWTSAVAVTTSSIKDIGGFPVGVDVGEDLLTWARLAIKYKIAYSSKHCAIFWQIWSEPDNHIRIPPLDDFVGDQLKLLKDSSHILNGASFRRYIALWHSMRASIYLQQGYPEYALKELRRMIELSVINSKFVFLSLMSIFPKKISKLFFNTILNLIRSLSKTR